MNEVTAKAGTWKNETTNKDTKMDEAVTELKTQCKAKYNDASVADENYPKANEMKYESTSL